PDPVMTVALTGPQWRRRRWTHFAHPGLRASQLVLGRIRNGEEPQGPATDLAATDFGDDPLAGHGIVPPVAAAHSRIKQRFVGERQTGVEIERVLQVLRRLVVAPEVIEDGGATLQRPRKIGL